MNKIHRAWEFGLSLIGLITVSLLFSTIKGKLVQFMGTTLIGDLLIATIIAQSSSCSYAKLGE